MDIDNTLLLNFLVALGIGLLIGAEREHNQGNKEDTSIAGVRTFTIASLLGAVSITFNFWLLVATVICVTIFSATAGLLSKTKGPGLTTEITLLFTVILGGLAMSQASLAAALAVCIAILLAAKEPLHGFVKVAVSKNELNDFLILAAATLIVLPLVPNEYIGPYEAVNLRNLWLIVILVMLINAIGHVALRMFGGRIGLPVTGLVSGFISSIAAIHSMGERARQNPALMGAAVAGAILSNLSTILKLSILVLVISPALLWELAAPLAFGGISIAVYGLIYTLNSLQKRVRETTANGELVSVKSAFLLASIIGIVILFSAMLQDMQGEAGLLIASGVAGLADSLAATISVASMVSTGRLTLETAVLPILVAISLNAVSKLIMAIVGGGKDFAWKVVPALTLQVSMIWIGWWMF